MPSENEIVDQTGNDQPDPDTEAQAPETAVVPSPVAIPAEPASEFAEEEDDAEEDLDWDSWLLANPESEEIVPVLAVAEELDAYLSGEDEFSDDEASDDEFTDDDLFAEDAEADDADLAQMDDLEEELAEVVAEADLITAVVETETSFELDALAEEVAVLVEETAVEIAVETVGEAVVETAVLEVLVESDEMLLETPPPAPAKPKGPKKIHPHGLTEKDVIKYFAACPRCGYFLTGYRAAYGEYNFETAVADEKGGWLTLNWGSNVRELILKSYGVVAETNDLLFNSCCFECHRALVYNGMSEDDQPATFRIEIKPQKR